MTILGAVCFSGDARPVGLGGVGGVVLRGLNFRSIRYVSSIVGTVRGGRLFRYFSAGWVVFGGRMVSEGWLSAGWGLAARRGGGHSYLNPVILIHFSFHAVVSIMVGIN